MSDLLKKIRSRSHWKVIIRPGTFDEKKIGNQSTLLHILEKTYVQFGNPVVAWPFPHIDSSALFDKGTDWVGQEKESELWEIAELWRFYQSGQFVSFTARTPKNTTGLSLLPGSLIVRFSEIFEFAARLSRTDAGDDWMHLEVIATELNLPLKVGADYFKLSDQANTNRQYQYTVDLSTLDLITKSRELALKPVQEFFQRFGWNPGIRFLRDYQDELLPRRSGALR